MEEKIRLAVFGQKRLSREGGIEIVVKELCTRMAQNGCGVTCYNRAGHHVSGAEYDKTIEYDGIRQKVVPTIEKKGYVGLSIATLLSQHHQVTAVDIIPEKVEMINNRKSPIQDDYIEKYLAEKDLDLTATLDAKAAYSDADFVVIAAPTNYDSHTQHFDTSAVEAVIKLVMEYNPNAIMVIKSTIPVGYTASVREKFNSKNIIFSPEFLRESKALYDNLYPSRIIVGTDLDDERLVEAAHGSPSPKLWREYAESIEKKNGKITYLTFKDKRNGWKAPTAFVTVAGYEYSIKDYVKVFYNRCALRPSCYMCPYATIERKTDMTIGDFWHIDKMIPDFYDENGNSLFLIHTDQGEKLFDDIKENLEYRLSDTKQCWQANLEAPTKKSELRDTFWEDYYREGIDYIMKKYGKTPLRTKVKNKLLKFMGGGTQKVTLAMLITPKGGQHNELEAA